MERKEGLDACKLFKTHLKTGPTSSARIPTSVGCSNSCDSDSEDQTFSDNKFCCNQFRPAEACDL